MVQLRRFFRTRPALAIAISGATLLLVVAIVVVAAPPLRCKFGVTGLGGCGTASTLSALHHSSTGQTQGTPIGIPTPFGNPASGATPPGGYPGSGATPPGGYPASGSYPANGNPATPAGPYPPYYPPASNGSVVTPISIDCRIPVYAGQPGSGGFIVLPGGSYVADPRSNVTLPSTTPTPPPGPGYGPPPGLSYDQQYSKWLAVATTSVSPDGSHYAYTGTDGIYIVNVASGAQTEVGQSQSWAIVGVEAAGVYASHQGGSGLWLFPFSGAARQITTEGYWQVVSATRAYGTSTSAVPQGASNTIIALDLSSGAITNWFDRSYGQSSLLGVDAQGAAIINLNFLNGSGSEIWIASGPSSATAIAGHSYFGFTAQGTPVADSHGIWFEGYGSTLYGSGASGVALYVPGSGLYWMSGISGVLAGACD